MVQEACFGRRLHHRAFAAPCAYACANVRPAPYIHENAHTHMHTCVYADISTYIHIEYAIIVRYLHRIETDEEDEEEEENCTSTLLAPYLHRT